MCIFTKLLFSALTTSALYDAVFSIQKYCKGINDNQMEGHIFFFLKIYIALIYAFYQNKIIQKYYVFSCFCILTLNVGSLSTNTSLTFLFTNFTTQGPYLLLNVIYVKNNAKKPQNKKMMANR